MSWSVWMWAAFRMILPSHCAHLISYLPLRAGGELLRNTEEKAQINRKWHKRVDVLACAFFISLSLPLPLNNCLASRRVNLLDTAFIISVIQKKNLIWNLNCTITFWLHLHVSQLCFKRICFFLSSLSPDFTAAHYATNSPLSLNWLVHSHRGVKRIGTLYSGTQVKGGGGGAACSYYSYHYQLYNNTQQPFFVKLKEYKTNTWRQSVFDMCCRSVTDWGGRDNSYHSINTKCLVSTITHNPSLSYSSVQSDISVYVVISVLSRQ